MTANGLTCDVVKQLGCLRLEAALEIPASGITALFGVSGSGKTSLLRLIAGLDRPDEGRIAIHDDVFFDAAQGRWVPPHRRQLGVVFQEARLFPHYRVRGNLTYGMPTAARSRFASIVELLGIEFLLERFPGTLSGGEARRVAIGRALLSAPRMLLMDEPLTGLDGARKQELLHYILRLAREIDIPILYVSHDPQELSAIADDLAIIDQGKIRAHDRLERLLMRFDLTEHLGGFDAISVLDAWVVGHDASYALSYLRLADGQQLTLPRLNVDLGTRLRLRIPVRDVALALASSPAISYRNQIAAVIEEVGDSEPGTSAVELRLKLNGMGGTNGQALRARLTRKSFDEMRLKKGMRVVALVRSVAFDTSQPPPQA
ncbi:molybdenum ABC transporter ATP-binding protein [Pistricoccus aurantiacus]|uniref:Molybdenum ABC transporter ATP-binding protein n=1 Tax=Pistricoccus aurantiacus TaxID=1883414 RepID=A0A5B8SRY9_9GAMM|nr:molybdenum ABC transporter ATP-binding protein [Pistricoccus aurantiacus]QEA37853.1 molybdenum ABC transporter ATP-binding protein [Pistricoccus aurantiacus]